MKPRSRIGALYDTYLRKRPKQERSRSIVESIFSAVVDGIQRFGDEDALSIQEIVERAGVGVGSFYDYFPDRRSLFAGVAAKVTEDNVRAFEAVLEECEGKPLRDLIARLVDFTFETYNSGQKKVYRSVLRIAHSVGLMPLMADNQTKFALSFASVLRRHSDTIGLPEERLDHAAYVIVQAMMGLIHTGIWQDDPPIPTRMLRDEVIDMFVSYLSDTSRTKAGGEATEGG